jgi:hypothetical protein
MQMSQLHHLRSLVDYQSFDEPMADFSLTPQLLFVAELCWQNLEDFNQDFLCAGGGSNHMLQLPKPEPGFCHRDIHRQGGELLCGRCQMQPLGRLLSGKTAIHEGASGRMAGGFCRPGRKLLPGELRVPGLRVFHPEQYPGVDARPWDDAQVLQRLHHWKYDDRCVYFCLSRSVPGCRGDGVYAGVYAGVPGCGYMCVCVGCSAKVYMCVCVWGGGLR